MKAEYIKYLSTLELSGVAFRTLMLLNLESNTQAQIAIQLDAHRQNINKVFNKLKDLGLIELVKRQGKNEFYRAVTDVKKLNINIPGQLKMI